MNIGIIGSGQIGLTVGKHLVDAGHAGRFAARDLGRLAAFLLEVGLEAPAVTPAETAAFGEVVFFAPPFGAWPRLARDPGPILKGKIVIDAANPYPGRDGEMAAQAVAGGRGSGLFVAALLPDARVVKAFNTLYCETLALEAHRTRDRLALPVMGDDASAMATVAGLIHDAGFEAVAAGPLACSHKFDARSPPYNKPLDAAGSKKRPQKGTERNTRSPGLPAHRHATASSASKSPSCIKSSPIPPHFPPSRCPFPAASRPERSP